MCNYFGGACGTGFTEEQYKQYSEQANREYKAMLASHDPMLRSSAYNEWLRDQAKPNDFIIPNPIYPKSWLTQAVIDTPVETTANPKINWYRLGWWVAIVICLWGFWFTIYQGVKLCLQ